MAARGVRKRCPSVLAKAHFGLPQALRYPSYGVYGSQSDLAQHACRMYAQHTTSNQPACGALNPQLDPMACASAPTFKISCAQ